MGTLDYCAHTTLKQRAHAHACRAEAHRRADRAWRRRNADDLRDQRWEDRLAREDVPRQPAGVPWHLAQDAMRAKAPVFLAGVAGVILARAKDAMRKQVREMQAGAPGVTPKRTQDAMASRGPPRAA